MRFFMISDLHLSNQGSKIADSTFQALYEKIRKNISLDEHLLFIVLGDIIDKGNIEGYVSAEKYFSSLRHELKDYKIKFEFIPGNHDLVNGSLSDFDTFISKMGVDYSFSNNPVVAKEYGNVNFIFADSNLSRDYKSSCEINLEEICLKVIKDKQNILFAIML